MKFFINGEAHELPDDVKVDRLSDRLLVQTPEGTRSAVAIRDGDSVLVSYLGRQFKLDTKAPRARSAGSVGSGELRAPMPGLIVDVLVSVGDSVAKGTKLAVLEAMKTQQPFLAPFDGVVTDVRVVKGQQVGDSDVCVVVGPAV